MARSPIVLGVEPWVVDDRLMASCMFASVSDVDESSVAIEWFIQEAALAEDLEFAAGLSATDVAPRRRIVSAIR